MLRRLENGECAIHVRAKIRFGLLDGRNDVGARREMEHALHARASRVDRGLIGNVRFDNFQPRIAMMLLKVGAPADDEAVEDAHAPALVYQAIDEMTADETRAACHQIDHNVLSNPMTLIVPAPASIVVRLY